MLDNIKTNKLKKYLEMMGNPERWEKDIKNDVSWAFKCVLQWVKEETEDHKCLECDVIIPAGNHNQLCCGGCEVSYA